MPERKTVREQARELALQALAKGQKPSALVIRDAIGTGSLGTLQDEIRKAKAEWEDGQRRQASFPDLPTGLAELASPFMMQLWSAACEYASRVFNEERTNWQQEIETLHRDVDASRQQQETLADELTRVQSSLEHAQALGQEQARSLELLRYELEHARAELVQEKEAARLKLQDMEQLHAETVQQANEEILQHVTRHTLLNDELIAARAEYERKLATLTAAHHQAIKGVTEDRDLARAKTSTLQSELQQVRHQLQLQEEKAQAAQMQLAVALGRTSEAEQHLAA
ncbi:DNA-binding protein [Paludibacterium denitrificans]|uniref:KfrA N-terminal DNA-binding domain-containing protein n=1 Tax=Paludibacterium denitrificans TaxID=2675226 RepID=A0A844GEW6_9NEIS|nr:DNA-binding protein [Paludibacterium denitrificans]MTD34209.1 hypothetical protein [Paludibacterium denitrificans]